jgi:hypothetical protein
MTAANSLDSGVRLGELLNRFLEWNIGINMVKQSIGEETGIDHSFEQEAHPSLAIVEPRLHVELECRRESYDLITLLPGVLAEHEKCVGLHGCIGLSLDLGLVEGVIAWSASEVDNLSVSKVFINCICPAKEDVTVVGVFCFQAVCLEHDLLCTVVIRVLITVRVEGATTSICDCGRHVLGEKYETRRKVWRGQAY